MDTLHEILSKHSFNSKFRSGKQTGFLKCSKITSGWRCLVSSLQHHDIKAVSGKKPHGESGRIWSPPWFSWRTYNPWSWNRLLVNLFRLYCKFIMTSTKHESWKSHRKVTWHCTSVTSHTHQTCDSARIPLSKAYWNISHRTFMEFLAHDPNIVLHPKDHPDPSHFPPWGKRLRDRLGAHTTSLAVN